MTDPLVAAYRRLAQARSDEAAALSEVKVQVRAWQERTGVPKTQAGDAIRALLEADGMTAEQIAQLGVSNDRVRQHLDGRRR